MSNNQILNIFLLVVVFVTTTSGLPERAALHKDKHFAAAPIQSNVYLLASFLACSCRRTRSL